MKGRLSFLTSILFIVFMPIIICAQINPAPVVGSTNTFILFTTSGAITNAGTTSIYSGSVGTNDGALTGFASLITQPTNLYAVTPETAQCAVDLSALYTNLVARTGTERAGAYTNETLSSGVYTTAGAASVGGILTLDGGGDSNARFIIKTGGAFTIGAGAKILLTNGAQAKNVFWVIAGACAIAANCEARGTFICYAGAISMGANCTLEGGALTIAGAITTLDGMTLATAVPLITNTMVLSASQTIIGGAAPADLVLTGNISPVIKWQSSTDPNFSTFTDILHFTPRLSGSCIGALNSITYYRAVILIDGIPAYSNRIKITTIISPISGSFALFTTAGAITNAGISSSNALIGTNAGAINGTFTNMSLFRIQDALTLNFANNLLPLFTSIKNTETTNNHAAALGAGEILMPGVYEINSAATLGGVLTLDGQGSDEVFIIKITGALAMAASSQIILTNGAIASNVFWVMDGALGVGASCAVKGTFICLAGAIALGNNCTTEGGIFTIAGAITLQNCTLTIPPISAIVLSANQTLAVGALPANLVLSGNISSVVKWQFATNIAFNNPTDIMRSSTILTGACIGPIINTTFFRAVMLIDGVYVYSNRVKIATANITIIGAAGSFALFTTAGAITNAAGTSINNELIGTNAGAITGTFSNMSFLHVADALTLAFANNLLPLFNSKKNTPTTNSHGATFNNGEILLPGVYQTTTAATLSGLVTLDGQNNPNSIFIIKITGALALAAGAEIKLINGATTSNVFWIMDGALGVGAACKINGTFICLAGAIALGNNCISEGRIFTIAGAITLQNCTLSIPLIPAPNQVILPSVQPQNLILTGNIDAVVRWEKSSDALFTTPIAIANTTTTLLGSQIGALTSTTYFRAVVLIGSSTINSSSVIIAVNEATVAVVAGAASSTPTLFINAVLTNITHSTTGATGIATPTGLPPGVTAIWASNAITISGTPTALGIFNYNIPLIGGCGNDATGTITVNPLVIVLVGGTVSPNQAFCSASTPVDLILSGNSGSVVKWQSSLTSDFAVPTDINFYATTLTSAIIGSLSVTTYFRAVVQSCTEPVRYGDFIKVSIAALTSWNGTSWSDGLPNDSKLVSFGGNYTVNENIVACSMTINNGAIVTINPGFSITVVNELTLSGGGLLRVENNASLVQINNAANNTGNIEVVRTTSTYENFDYIYWSSPVMGAAIAAPMATWRLDRVYQFITSNFSDLFGGSNPQTTGSPDLFDDNGDDWQNISGTTLMQPAKGYIVMSPYTQTPTTNTVSFNGIPNNGIYNFPLALSANDASDNDDFNLVGNPYPSALDADSFIKANLIAGGAATNNISGALYFWTHVGNIQPVVTNPGPAANNFNADDYATYTLAGGVGVASGSGSSIPLGKIASGQGFFVEAETTNNLVFNNAMRSGNYLNNQFYKTNNNNTTQNEPEKDRLRLNFQNLDNMFSQQLIGYFDNATIGYDYGYDGMVSQSQNYVSFYSLMVENQYLYRIQAQSTWDNSKTVALGYSSSVSGTSSIAIGSLEGVFNWDTTEVYLQDNLLNITHDLKQGPYFFTTEIGTFNTRFILKYVSATLATIESTAYQNTVIVATSEQQLIVKSVFLPVAKIAVFDLLGRAIFENNKVDKNEFVIDDLVLNQQTLIVKITLDNGTVVNRKVFFF